MKNFWNERYGSQEYVYGKGPNVFFAEQLKQLPPGKILLPAEGEGRNAVFAAAKGWEVCAFDASEAGKMKAEKLAAAHQVSMEYLVADAANISYAENSFDLIAIIYAHFPEGLRKEIHQKAIRWLKPGGTLLVEAFHTEQLQYESGGPKSLELLYREEMLREDFKELEIQLMQTTIVHLEEGIYHRGKAKVIRFIAGKSENKYNKDRESIN